MVDITKILDARPFKCSTDSMKRVQINIFLGFRSDVPPPSPTFQAAFQQSRPPTLILKRDQKKLIKEEKVVVKKRRLSRKNGRRPRNVLCQLARQNVTSPPNALPLDKLILARAPGMLNLSMKSRKQGR